MSKRTNKFSDQLADQRELRAEAARWEAAGQRAANKRQSKFNDSKITVVEPVTTAQPVSASETKIMFAKKSILAQMVDSKPGDIIDTTTRAPAMFVPTVVEPTTGGNHGLMTSAESKKLAIKAKTAADTPPTAEDITRTKTLVLKQAAELALIKETGTAIVKPTKTKTSHKPVVDDRIVPLINKVDATLAVMSEQAVDITELKIQIARLNEFMGAFISIAAMLGVGPNEPNAVPMTRLIAQATKNFQQPTQPEKPAKVRKVHIYTDAEKAATRARLLAGQQAAKARREAAK